MKKAALHNLGCKVNSYETEAMQQLLENAGYEIVPFAEGADVYIINTCSVTNIADRKSRQMLHQAKKRNPEAVIAAAGCYVQASEEELIKDNAVDLIIGNNKKSDVVAMVERYFESRNKEELVSDIWTELDYEELQISSTLEKTRAFIKIQDGCNRFCSYCIIPYVRGRVRSREEQEVLSEIEGLAKKGYQEIVLTGIHISSYGTDRLKGEEEGTIRHPLAELIVKIGQIPGIERIRIGSLEPRIITEEFVQIIAGVRQFCPHFHLSLQSGSDTVLSRMNRKYSAEEYYEKVKLLKQYFDNPAFTTDVIVGFPQETEEEFQETCNFVQRIGFSHIHVFKFSKREGTKAATMTGQLSEEIKHQRSNRLITIAARMSEEYKALFMGKIEKILIEEEITVDGEVYQTGHNERYQKLAIRSCEDLSNRIITAKVGKDLNGEILLCEIIH